MKKFLILILICTVQSVFSQTEIITIDEPTNKIPPQGAVPNDDNSIYSTAGIEVKPEFPGGIAIFNTYMEQNFQIPNVTPALKGRIYVTFIIEKDGSLSDIKVLRDLGHETGREAIRVLKNTPKWIPGKQNNKLVRVLYSLPIPINIPAK